MMERDQGNNRIPKPITLTNETVAGERERESSNAAPSIASVATRAAQAREAGKEGERRQR
jgi:hypothetical protein